MPLVNHVEPYMPGTIPFSQYLEQLDWIFINNKTTEESDQKASFLAACGKDVYSEIKLLFPGKDLKTVSFKEITDALKKRYDKTESDMIQRFKFYQRVQGQAESAEDFILAVKQQAELCEFGDFKDIAIRDKLVCGINDPEVQQRLFDEEGLTLAKAEKIIINREIAGARLKQVSRESGRVSLNRLGKREEREVSRGRFRGRSRGPSRRSRSRSRSGSFDRRNRSKSRSRKFHCSFCDRDGHTRRFCYDLKNKEKKFVKFAEPLAAEPKLTEYQRSLRHRLNRSIANDEEMECLLISSIKSINEPCFRTAVVEGAPLEMEIDCGAAVSVISLEMYEGVFADIRMQKCTKKLAVINGSRLVVEGQLSVDVELNGRRTTAKLIVLRSESDFTPLLGRDWLDIFYPDWRNAFDSGPKVNQLSLPASEEMVVDEIKTKFAKVFDKSMFTPIKGFQADLVLKKGAAPIFKRAYDVPLRLKDKVVEHLESLEKDGVITPIDASEWASPVICVVKKDGGIRMVIDCKVSINKVIIPNTYPLPLAQDIFASLAGAKVFCSLDLTGAYTQLLLSEKSRKIMVINTIKGLFAYNRLPQGASSSAAIFQRVMDQVLKGIDGVYVYLDDVLIAGVDYEDCLRKLNLVLERLSKANIKVSLQKCKWFVKSLPFLGHVLSDKGLQPCPEKVETIRRAKIPNTVSELKAFLGLINYYGKFIPNLSSRLSCLYRLLKKDVKFVWTDECTRVFEDCKQLLVSSKMLELFDPQKPVVVVTDACSYGLGGVIAHEIDGEERPISFTSFSLTNSQKSYPILHLEALAIVSTIKKFHKFLFGKKFTVYTDHKPLIGIFGKEGKNSLFVTRLQRYVMELNIYDFDIVYRPSSKLGNADFCSRFPLPENVPDSLQREYIKSLNVSNEFPLDHVLIANETKKDEFLQTIVYYMKHGWPSKLERSLLDVYAQHQDLELVDGCLLYQDRVFIPASLQKQILKLLHKNHSGITKIKQLARRTVYWIGMNTDIESFVKYCSVCCQMNAVPKPVPHSTWIPTTKPFTRIHADFFYFDKKVFLVIVDSFSKWLEVEYMKFGTDARKVISKFVSVFARFGLPDVVVTDGGPPFNSTEFTDFLQRHGIRVMKSPPYNPSSNGQAERMVRAVKEGLKKFLLDPEMIGLSTEDLVSYFLFGYRNTCLGDGQSFPSEKLFSFKPKTLLDLIHPRNSFKHHSTKQAVVDNRVVDSPSFNPKNHDWIDKLRPGDTVYYKNFRPTDIRRWLEAKFIRRVSSNVFEVSVGGRVYSAHRNQLKLYGTPKKWRSLVFEGENMPSQQRKRTRDDDDDEDDRDDDDAEFFGFAADSFLYRSLDEGRDSGRDQESERVREEVVRAREQQSTDSGGVDNRSFAPMEVDEDYDPHEGPSSRQPEFSQLSPEPKSSSSRQPEFGLPPKSTSESGLSSKSGSGSKSKSRKRSVSRSMRPVRESSRIKRMKKDFDKDFKYY